MSPCPSLLSYYKYTFTFFFTKKKCPVIVGSCYNFFYAFVYLFPSCNCKMKVSTTLSTLSFEILTCIAEQLTANEIIVLSQCSKAMYQLQYLDLIWRKHCRIEFGVDYNHPNQTFRELYVTCRKIQKGENTQKRLPCNHINSDMISVSKSVLETLDQCERCSKEGLESLFLCVSPQCYQTSETIVTT